MTITDLTKELIAIKSDYSRVRSVGNRRYLDTGNIQFWAVIDNSLDTTHVITYSYNPFEETEEMALVNFRHRIEDYLSEGE